MTKTPSLRVALGDSRNFCLVRPTPRCLFSCLAALIGLRVAAVAAPLQPFEFDAKFEPAFLPKSHLTLRSSGDSAKLVIDISGDSTSVPVAIFGVTKLDSTGTMYYHEFVKVTKERSIKW
jgi:hypothetical protein